MKRTLSIGQWATVFLALPGGFILGVMTGILQATTLKVGGIAIPWGLAAALFLIWLAVRLPSYDVNSRWVGVLVGIGWLIATVMLAIQTPAGDLVLIGDTRSMVYIALGSVTVGVAAAWPLIRKGASGASELAEPEPGPEPLAATAVGVVNVAPTSREPEPTES